MWLPLCPCIWSAGQPCTSFPVSSSSGLVETVFCCTRFSQCSFLLCTVCFLQAGRTGREEEERHQLQPLEIVSLGVENHLEFRRQNEAATFCLLFLEFLFFSEQMIRIWDNCPKPYLPGESSVLLPVCSLPCWVGEHAAAARSRELMASNGLH